MARPKTHSSLAEKELDKVEEQFKAFDDNVKQLTQDSMNRAPLEEKEAQVKLSQSEKEKSNDIYLKPFGVVASKEQFNEKFREDYNFKKEYVYFTAENHEIIGEEIELWTKPFAGMPAERWKVPVNIPIWGPRYLAEQLKNCTYHRLKMVESRKTGTDGQGHEYFGSMAASSKVQRLDAIPCSPRKSVFMGSKGF